MKKITLVFSMFTLLALASCVNTEQEEAATATPATGNSPATPTQQQPATPAKTTTRPDGTTIKVGDDGVSFENKNGTKGTNVNISGDSSSIQINRPR